MQSHILLPLLAIWMLPSSGTQDTETVMARGRGDYTSLDQQEWRQIRVEDFSRRDSRGGWFAVSHGRVRVTGSVSGPISPYIPMRLTVALERRGQIGPVQLLTFAFSAGQASNRSVQLNLEPGTYRFASHQVFNARDGRLVAEELGSLAPSACVRSILYQRIASFAEQLRAYRTATYPKQDTYETYDDWVRRKKEPWLRDYADFMDSIAVATGPIAMTFPVRRVAYDPESQTVAIASIDPVQIPSVGGRGVISCRIGDMLVCREGAIVASGRSYQRFSVSRDSARAWNLVQRSFRLEAIFYLGRSTTTYSDDVPVPAFVLREARLVMDNSRLIGEWRGLGEGGSSSEYMRFQRRVPDVPPCDT